MLGSIVITSPEDEDFLTFGEIKAILVTKGQKILLCTRCWDTAIQKTSRKKILLWFWLSTYYH